MIAEFAEFRIIISHGETITVRYTPTGQAHDVMEFATRPLSIADIRRRTIEMQIRLLRKDLLRDREDLQCMGENLFATLFYTGDGQGYNDFGRALRDAIRDTERGDDEQSDKLLRVAFQFDNPTAELATWPWEYLYHPQRERESLGGFFLAHRARIVLTRFLALADIDWKRQPLRPPLKILLVAPNPDWPADSGFGPIESDALRDDLENLDDTALRVELKVLPADREAKVVLFDEFKYEVANFKPHVVHFVGHGEHTESGGRLAFTNDMARVEWIDDIEFASAVEGHDSLRLVFLQACESAQTGPSTTYQVVAGVAQWVSQRNIPAVVAMHYAIENRIGSAVARAFHAELVERHSVEAALNAARSAARAGRRDAELFASFGLPVLYIRGIGQVLDPDEAPVLETETMLPDLGRATERCPFDQMPYDPTSKATAGNASTLWSARNAKSPGGATRPSA